MCSCSAAAAAAVCYSALTSAALFPVYTKRATLPYTPASSSSSLPNALHLLVPLMLNRS